MKKLLLVPIIGLAAFAITSCKSGTNQSSSTTTETADSGKALKPAVKTSALTALTPATYTLDGVTRVAADIQVNAFINGGHEGDYDAAHHTCIWYCKDAWVRMSKVADSVGAEGVRFYFAKNSDGNYTAIPVITKQGPQNPQSVSGFSHTDFFLQKNPKIPNCGLSNSPVGHLGEVRPDQGASMYSATPDFSAYTPCPPNQSPHYLKAQQAHDMIYNNCGMQGVSNKFNSVSEWFDIGVVTSLASAIPGGGGVRLYYARHSSPGQYDNNVARHGLVIVLTKPVGTYQQDFFTCITFSGLYYQHLLPRDPGDGATDNGEECPTNCIGAAWSDQTINP